MNPQSNQSVRHSRGTIDQLSTLAAHLPGERRFYLIAAVGIIVVVLAGFSIDFDLLFDMSSLSFLARAHGLVMFAWVGVFFAQVFLVARHRVDLHRRLGIFGAALALLIVIIGTYTSIVAARLGGNHWPPGIPAIPFLSSSLLLLLTFTVLAGAGLAMRQRPGAHKRLMLLATMLLLDAALVRFISAYTHWSIQAAWVRNLLVLACIVVDALRHRRFHPAFLAGGLLLLAYDFTQVWLAGTTAWLHFAKWLLT
jgi:hypothetical protein